MPLFDLQWAISIINEKNLEQAGIISNFFAGILLAIEYFVIKDRIDQINNLLELHITNAYSKGLRIVKAYAKWNRWIILIIITAIVLITLYETIFYHSASVGNYIVYYYSLAKSLLIPMRRILLASLAVLFIMFIILFIAHSAPKRTLGAFGILFYILGNIMLFLHTLFR
jgi:hypothetical protein